MVIENLAPMWAQIAKIEIKNIPPSNKIFFLRPRRRRHRRQSHHQEQREKSSCRGSGSEKHLNVIRRRAAALDSRCCRSSSSSSNFENKTTQYREFSPSSSSPRSLLDPLNINPNKLVAIIEESFNRGSVGSAREPLWMEV